MLKWLQNKQEGLLMKKQEEGLTFIEMLVVVIIIAIVSTLVAIAFLGVFGQVDGTEKLAESRSVEGAVLQVSLADSERRIPGNGETLGWDEVSANAAVDERLVSTFDATETGNFNQEYGGWVFDKVAEDAGITTAELENLTFELDAENVSGKIDGEYGSEGEEYYVVVRQEQINQTDRPATSYNDALAGKIFTANSIQDSDGVVYNGSFSFTEAELEDFVPTP